jgi:uncharacterized protein
MLGVLVNAVAVVGGATIGLIFKRFISNDLSRFIEATLGYCTIIVGIKMAMQFENVLLWVGCVGLGGILGFSLRLEQNIERAARWVQRLVVGNRESRFALGLTNCSILFCVGGMAVVGSINSGVMGDHEVLFTKSVLDGVISAPMAGVYGVGVAFAAIPVLVYQGGIALLASKAAFLNQPHVIHELSGVGGVLIFMIGLNLSKLSKIPVGDFLPAMALILIAALFM